MEPTPPAPIFDARVRAFVVVSLLLATVQVWRLVPFWHAWRAGAPDLYPGQHRGLLLGAVTGLTIALAIPIPLIVARLPKAMRGSRLALWTVWAVLMAITAYGLFLQR